MIDSILFTRHGHVAQLTLNKPEKHNSLGQQELEAIQHHLKEVASDRDVRVLVVTGAGEKTFCAGAALNELGAGKISGDHFQATTDMLAQLPIPTIASLNGNVFGGGVELALSCDFRIGVEGSRMRVPAAAIGLCYPISGINRFVERLGVNLAKRILVASETFTAAQMLDVGFLDHLVTSEGRAEKTSALAEHIAGLAPLAVRAMKDILQQAAGQGIDPEAANVLSHLCLESDDLQEGFAAQREKRKPVFSGC
ncbi:3-hydroxybutyryl-CoA dehydratase [Halioglobus sp. HI00S01]|uniref:enoyl-CoA hydratase/isomerase family protein n=1 Tax=Halioglobus sp. HI00S01 TaxID=1822214 RepID=UPI0007C32890|nr:enoyl-CoA hydratase/isomerase family protein [Halioglobus sp. HI00S01]KZX55018.1 3-hydroxybutyryl-CoA dehydratase [Halioglobus sp. HI00S01]